MYIYVPPAMLAVSTRGGSGGHLRATKPQPSGQIQIPGVCPLHES